MKNENLLEKLSKLEGYGMNLNLCLSDIVKWKHYFKILKYCLSVKDIDECYFKTNLDICQIDKNPDMFTRYLTASEVVKVQESLSVINEILNKNKGSVSIAFMVENIEFKDSNKCETQSECENNLYKEYSPIKSDEDQGVEAPLLDDYETWHYIDDRLPHSTFMCIVKMWNKFSGTWTTGTGIYDTTSKEWEVTDSCGESWDVRYWRRCPNLDTDLPQDVRRKSTTEAANPNQPPVVHISEKIVNELTSLKETTKLNHAMSEEEKKWALLLLGTAIERIYNVFASEDENEYIIRQVVDFNIGDVVILNSDASKVMTVCDVLSSHEISCMFWSNDQMIQMSFPTSTLTKL